MEEKDKENQINKTPSKMARLAWPKAKNMESMPQSLSLLQSMCFTIKTNYYHYFKIFLCVALLEFI